MWYGLQGIYACGHLDEHGADAARHFYSLEEKLLSGSRYGLWEYSGSRSPLRPLILYLERDPKALDIRKAVLEREGYSVIGVARREDALRTLRDSPVSLTITDHLFSANQSSEVAREMKKIKPDVPIILFSNTVPQHFDGVDVYVNKGEPTAEFLRIVRYVIE